MSRIKELKEDPENGVNLVDMLKLFFPEIKSKYVEMFIKLTKKEFSDEYETKGTTRTNYIKYFTDTFPQLNREELDSMSTFKIITMYRIAQNLEFFNVSEELYKFIDFN